MNHLMYHYKALDGAVAEVLRRQCMDETSAIYGAIEQLDKGYTGGHSAIGAARQLIDGYYTPECAYYHERQLLERAAAAIDFAASMQHEDGTLDLFETNFHDGAETAFIIQNIGPSYIMMRERMGDTPEEQILDQKLMAFVHNCADGILNGGFHTPNHRWVLSAALALCYKLTGREECMVRVRQFLDEGIDCDEEGEYTERSAGVYNIVCDRALITLAKYCGMTELYDHVTRNLNMVMKYFEPDRTINTLNSTRQDVGTAPDWRIYYGCYYYMALQTGNAEFKWIADTMLAQTMGAYAMLCATTPPIPYFEYLPFLAFDPELMAKAETMTASAEPDLNYVKLFEKSGIVRARKGDFSMTLVKERPIFAMLQYKNHVAYLRLAGSFYAKGQFAAQTLEETESGFLMTYKMRWGYKGVMPTKPSTSVWADMDHSLRPDIHMQDYILKVHVTFCENSAEFEIVSEGVECVPTKLEIMLAPGGNYVTDSVEINARGGEYFYQKSDKSEYRYSDHHKLCISGGYHKDSYGEAMRGTLMRDDQSVFIAMTQATPVKEKVTLTFC